MNATEEAHRKIMEKKIDLDKIFTQGLNESISVTQINSTLLFTKPPLPRKTNKTKNSHKLYL